MKIAIVGAGFSGLHAASVLHEMGHDITVFEANDYIGGHVQTQRVPFEDKGQAQEAIVDLGVFMFDPISIHPYVKSLILKKHLSLDTALKEIPLDFTIQVKNKEDMAFLFKTDYTQSKRSKASLLFHNLKKTIAHEGWLKPKGYWKCIKNFSLIKDLFRFHFLLQKLGEDPNYKLMSLSAFIEEFGFSDTLVQKWILPQLQCWWGSTRESLLNTSIQTFSDSVFKVSNHPQYTFSEGVDSLINLLSESIKPFIKLSTPVTEIIRTPDYVLVNQTQFDAVLLAINPQAALKILQTDEQEKQILSQYDTATTTVFLHTDTTSWLPSKSEWSTINLLQDDNNVVTTFWVGRLHDLAPPIFLTWGDELKLVPCADKILKTSHFQRTLPTLNTIEASEKIRSLQGKNRTWYCGAHVHALADKPHSLWADNALQSGLQAAEAIDSKARA